MEKNKFIVDLGNLELSEEQRGRINASIQKAVTGELASINLKEQIVLIPVHHFPHGGIFVGMIAHVVKATLVDQLLGK